MIHTMSLPKKEIKAPTANGICWEEARLQPTEHLVSPNNFEKNARL